MIFAGNIRRFLKVVNIAGQQGVVTQGEFPVLDKGKSERDTAARVLRYISEHACEKLTLANAARDLGISESHLSHLFSQRFHINFRRFINAIRVDKAMAWMRDPRMTLTTICGRCGYENMRTFRRAFLRETGQLPNAYMKSIREGEALAGTQTLTPTN